MYVYMIHVRPIHLENAVLLATSSSSHAGSLGVVGEALLLLSMRGRVPTEPNHTSSTSTSTTTENGEGGGDAVSSSTGPQEEAQQQQQLPDKVVPLLSNNTLPAATAAGGDEGEQRGQEDDEGPDLVLLKQAQENLQEAIDKVGRLVEEDADE